MSTVKINNKKYNVPLLAFGDLTTMEAQGLSLFDAFKKNQIFTIAMGFTCVVAKVERTEAENMLQQHVLGGGDIIEVYKAFLEAVEKSDFFRKLLNQEETEETETVPLKKAKKSGQK